MNDQPHVGLVHPHTKCIGGRDHLQLAVEELSLGLLAQVGGEPPVVAAAGDALLREDLGKGLGVLASGAEHHGRVLPAQAVAQQLDDALRLLSTRGRHHRIGQVGPLVAAQERLQLDLKAFLEVAAEVLDDVGLGSGGEARHRCLPRKLLPDEAGDVQVVRPEVVAPL